MFFFCPNCSLITVVFIHSIPQFLLRHVIHHESVRTFLEHAQNCEKRLLASSCLSVHLSVCPHKNISASTGPIFIKFDNGIFV